MSYLKLKLILF